MKKKPFCPPSLICLSVVPSSAWSLSHRYYRRQIGTRSRRKIFGEPGAWEGWQVPLRCTHRAAFESALFARGFGCVKLRLMMKSLNNPRVVYLCQCLYISPLPKFCLFREIALKIKRIWVHSDLLPFVSNISKIIFMLVSQQIRAKSELRRGHGPLCNLSNLPGVSSLPMPPQTIWQSEHCSRGEGQSQQHSY